MNETLRTLGAVIYCTLVTISFFACLYMIFVVKIEGEQEKYLLIMLGALITSFKDVGNYFTGSTVSSQKQQDQIATMANKATDTAATAAATLAAKVP